MLYQDQVGNVPNLMVRAEIPPSTNKKTSEVFFLQRLDGISTITSTITFLLLNDAISQCFQVELVSNYVVGCRPKF